MKTFTPFLAITLSCLLAFPAYAASGKLKVPLTGAQVLFQVLSNPGGGIPGGMPSLDLRNVRSTTPVVDATIGGEPIKYSDLGQDIANAIDNGAPDQGVKIDLIGSYPDRDWCRMVYSVKPYVTFIRQPETLKVIENRPGHLTASFDEIVRIDINVQANIFNIPMLGSRHVEADIFVLLGVHGALNDVAVWPPNTNDIFNSGNPPTLNTNHVELTLQQLAGNVELSGLQTPVVLSGFLISVAGIAAAPLTFGLSTILTILGPLLAIAAPGVEELAESILNAFLSQGIEAGIEELDGQLKDAIAAAGNQINAANAVSTIAPHLFNAAQGLNNQMSGWFGASFHADTAISNDVVAAGLTVKRNPGPVAGPNTVPAQIRFPRYKCVYERGAFVETIKSCDGKHLTVVDIYEMVPKLVPVNTEIVGRSCANSFVSDLYARSYLGSDWAPPNAQPDWQPLAASMSNSTVQQVTSNGDTYYACNLDVGSLPSNIIVDFGAKPGSGLARRIVPVRQGYGLPDQLAIDPTPFLGRVHMVVRPDLGPAVVMNEQGNPVWSRSAFGDVGPQQNSLATDCPTYEMVMDGGFAGSCSHNGHNENPCGECY